MAIGPRSSLRVTVPQGVMFGGAEEDVVERGECHNVEMGGRNPRRLHGWMVTNFLCAQHLDAASRLEPCYVVYMRTLTCEVCAVYTPRRLQTTTIFRLTLNRVSPFVKLTGHFVINSLHVSDEFESSLFLLLSLAFAVVE